MNPLGARFTGVELYFRDLPAAKRFYADTLGLELEEDQPTHHAKFGAGGGFVCLERKGVEDYPSADKAVLFLEVADVRAAAERIGAPHLVRLDLSASPPWAAIRDPEGHTVLLVERLP